MKLKNYVQAITAPSCVYLFFCVSCQNYQPFSDEEVFRWSYQQNFEKTFGPIAPDQSWDFSACSYDNNRLKTKAGEENLLSEKMGGFFETDAVLYQYIVDHIQFTDKTDRSFAMRIRKDDYFEIIPVYVTPKSISGLGWSLQVFVNTENLTENTLFHGWPMWQDMYIRKRSGGDYVKPGESDICTKLGVKSAPIMQYKNEDDAEKLMYFNLYITGNNNVYTYGIFGPTKSQQSSLNYQMRILNPTEPMEIEGCKALFVACEAANFDPENPYTANDGKRYQSLVFMVVGPKIPEVVYLEENQQDLRVEKSSVGKRFMIEDMGSTSDFDFNDIIVDVSQRTMVKVQISQKRTANYNNGILTNVSLGEEQPETGMTYQYLCGTKPFCLTVGDYQSQIITDPTNPEQSYLQMQPATEEDSSDILSIPASNHHIGWQPDPSKASFPVTGWNPEQNNISVTVWRNGKTGQSEGGWKVQFPADGEVPYIMALPIGEDWSAEGIQFLGWRKYLLTE